VSHVISQKNETDSTCTNPPHIHNIALHFMHYNFCRVHQTLRVMPAMQAGLTDHVWEIEELVALMDRSQRGPLHRSSWLNLFFGHWHKDPKHQIGDNAKSPKENGNNKTRTPYPWWRIGCVSEAATDAKHLSISFGPNNSVESVNNRHWAASRLMPRVRQHDAELTGNSN
jgi:hypothetical protein